MFINNTASPLKLLIHLVLVLHILPVLPFYSCNRFWLCISTKLQRFSVVLNFVIDSDAIFFKFVLILHMTKSSLGHENLHKVCLISINAIV